MLCIGTLDETIAASESITHAIQYVFEDGFCVFYEQLIGEGRINSDSPIGGLLLGELVLFPDLGYIIFGHIRFPNFHIRGCGAGIETESERIHTLE